GGIDHLVLLHPALALKGGGFHGRSPVIVITGQILNHDLRIRESLPDHRLDLVTLHAHQSSAFINLGNQPSWAARRFATAIVCVSSMRSVSPPVRPSSATMMPAARASSTMDCALSCGTATR